MKKIAILVLFLFLLAISVAGKEGNVSGTIDEKNQMLEEKMMKVKDAFDFYKNNKDFFIDRKIVSSENYFKLLKNDKKESFERKFIELELAKGEAEVAELYFLETDNLDYFNEYEKAVNNFDEKYNEFKGKYNINLNKFYENYFEKIKNIHRRIAKDYIDNIRINTAVLFDLMNHTLTLTEPGIADYYIFNSEQDLELFNKKIEDIKEAFGFFENNAYFLNQQYYSRILNIPVVNKYDFFEDSYARYYYFEVLRYYDVAYISEQIVNLMSSIEDKFKDNLGKTYESYDLYLNVAIPYPHSIFPGSRKLVWLKFPFPSLFFQPQYKVRTTYEKKENYPFEDPNYNIVWGNFDLETYQSLYNRDDFLWEISNNEIYSELFNLGKKKPIENYNEVESAKANGIENAVAWNISDATLIAEVNQ